jgi:hypothetical protein
MQIFYNFFLWKNRKIPKIAKITKKCKKPGGDPLLSYQPLFCDPPPQKTQKSAYFSAPKTQKNGSPKKSLSNWFGKYYERGVPPPNGVRKALHRAILLRFCTPRWGLRAIAGGSSWTFFMHFFEKTENHENRPFRKPRKIAFFCIFIKKLFFFIF